jgi:O-Antigen ligase
MTEVALTHLRPPTRRRSVVPLLLTIVGILAAYALAAYMLVSTRPLLAVAFALLPLLIWESTRLTAALVMLGASLPAFGSIIGGETQSINVALSDLLLAFVFGCLILRAFAAKESRPVAVLRPVAMPVLQYGVLALLLLFVHSGLRDLAQTAQRFELFLIPLIIGAFAALSDKHIQVLKGYVVAATLLAAIWPVHDFALQKNPVGQFIGNAILVVIAVKPLRAFLPCLLILVPGILLTQSRGAVAATLIGVAVVAVIHRSRGGVLLTRLLPLAAVGFAAFTLIPVATQARLTTFSPGTQTRAQYALHIRQQYAQDAHQVIAAHPWTGIGIGRYRAGDPAQGTQSVDPHQVVLLQAAEGGYLFAASFLLLILGTFVVIYTMREIALAPAAAAVFISTLAHGFRDVYWVRGTPVLAWLLVGMVCALHARRASTEPAR